MINIYYVRHGETYFNLKNLIQGQSDAPLTDKGLESALITKERVQHIEFDIAYSSDLRRAYETLQMIVDTKVKQVLLKEFRELNFGIYEGDSGDGFWKRKAEAYNFDLKAMSLVDRYQYVYHPIDNPKGEKLQDFKTRLYSGLLKIVKEATLHQHKKILLVGHGLAIRSLIEMLDPNHDSDIVPNASVTKISFDGEKFALDYVGRIKDID